MSPLLPVFDLTLTVFQTPPSPNTNVRLRAVSAHTFLVVNIN